jgi:hypothetical protein
MQSPNLCEHCLQEQKNKLENKLISLKHLII